MTREEYAENTEKCVYFLNGNYDVITKELAARMKEYAEKLDFERAAEMRDLKASVDRLSEQQKADECDNDDRDILAAHVRDDKAVVACFFMREGKLLGREYFYLSGVSGDERRDILDSFIKQYYSGTPHIPKEIYVSDEPEDTELLEKWLSEMKGRKVTIRNPKKGDGLRLTELAMKNAEMVLQKDEQRLSELELKTTGALKEIKTLLNLDKIYRIESYDISNTQGFENVASMVVFEDGAPKKSDYRRFKIKSAEGKPDDFKSMREVTTRRYGKLTEDELPDLIVIDGGKGQLSSALEIIRGAGHNDVAVVGLAKQFELIFVEGESEPVELPRNSEALYLMQRIRDEAHRFAITYHRKLRGKRNLVSVLDHVEGIGAKRRQALFSHFGSLQKIKEASVEELKKAPGMNETAAIAVTNFFAAHKNLNI